ncbi:APC family permease [Amycolatopsis keratiniphila]|uniref:Amino acid transporter n=1 Tax=Amycolatopsis keratiniphila subsp. keratiniphila TaxID=227715 RepID=A0A1W2M172_9PSEU|nr:APC family permease [Amycolatopsis keratiniphila]ONF73567.1 amino acid transporter [Amycolatopsis keratiniphila subsp. keratiniphila]
MSTPALRRGLRTLGTLLITLSAISPASSVFIIAPGVISGAGTGAFYSFVAAAVVGVFMAFVYAELASAFPLAGGEYAIVTRTLGRLPGFAVLGLMIITQVLIVAVIALGVGTYLGVLLPGVPGSVIAAATCVVAAVVGVFDIKLNAWVTGIFLAIEILALIVVSALGLLNPARSFTELLANPVASDGGPATVGAIAIATSVAIFAYNGYGSAVYFGEETQDASRGIARAILMALGITVLAELIPVTAVLLGAPDLNALFASENMLSYFIGSRGGGTLDTVLGLAVALAIINAVLAIVLISSRMLFSSGRDRAWPSPVNRALAAVHPKFGTPWVATVGTGLVAALLCFVDPKLLLVVTSTSIVAVYAALCLGAIVGRRTGATAHAKYRMPWFPVAPVLALGVLVFVVYQNVLDPSVGRPSLIVTACVALLSIAYYVLVLRRRGGWKLADVTEEKAEEPA